MSSDGLKKLIAAFREVDALPVEVEDIRQKIIDLGFQDEIIIQGVHGDPGHIKGVFYQYKMTPAVYAEKILCTVIGFNLANPLPWQRLSCAKELMHVFDDDLERTNTAAELDRLMDKLLGPMSTDDVGLADLMALKDKMALYEAIPILFPIAARNACLNALAAGFIAKEEVIIQACLPPPICELVLGDDWPKWLELLNDC